MCALIGKTINSKAEAYYRKDNWPSDNAYIYDGKLAECKCRKRLWFFSEAFKRWHSIQFTSLHEEPRKAHHSKR